MGLLPSRKRRYCFHFELLSVLSDSHRALISVLWPTPLSSFQRQLSTIYTLLSPPIFEEDHLNSLTTTESLLLTTIILISSRFCSNLPQSRRQVIHETCSVLAKSGIASLMDGSAEHRNIICVKALLLLSEWPPQPLPRSQSDSSSDVLYPSRVYDTLSWSYIGSFFFVSILIGSRTTDVSID